MEIKEPKKPNITKKKDYMPNLLAVKGASLEIKNGKKILSCCNTYPLFYTRICFNAQTILN